MFYYYGAKKQLAQRYPNPAGSLIVEPFGGSAAYACYHLRRDENLTAVVIEKDSRVVDLWKKLLGMTPDEIRKYPTPVAGDKTSDYFVMVCATGNAINKCKRMTITERMPRIFDIMKCKVAETVEKAGNRITVINGDYTDAEKFDGDGVTFFVDPPYAPNNRPAKGSVYGGGKGYAKGCCSESIDYMKVANFCKTRTGSVIACDYSDAYWLPFSLLKESTDSLKAKFNEGIWSKGFSLQNAEVLAPAGEKTQPKKSNV
jgi:hypothetical protein